MRTPLVTGEAIAPSLPSGSVVRDRLLDLVDAGVRGPVVLILDDLQRIHDPGVLDRLEYLARHATPAVRLIIATRTQLLAEQLDSGAAAVPTSAQAAMSEPLTDRELTVLRYLQSVLSTSEIAGELSVSVNTVKTHVRNIYRKLNIARRGDAVRRARALRLI